MKANKQTDKTKATKSRAKAASGKSSAKASSAAKPSAKAAPKEQEVQQALHRASPIDKKQAAKNLPHIDAKTLSEIIDKLVEMREESMRIIYHDREPGSRRPWEETVDVGDDLDQASNERDREFNLIMHQRHLRRLQQIDEAIEKMGEGTYGLCEGTEEPINPRRLLAMPLTRYSLEYQEHQEKLLGRGVEEESFYPGEDSFESED